MTDATRLDALTRKIEALEDQIAIRDALARYCLAADRGDPDAVAVLFAEGCAVDIDEAVHMKGREQVHASVASQPHQAMLPRSAHVAGPFLVQVHGSKAAATGYLTLFMKGDGGTAVARQSLVRWELEKAGGQWLITQRTSRSVGREDTRVLLDRCLKG